MEHSKLETTIFFGNGVNLLCKEGKSWDAILKQISIGQVIASIPNTLKYESIVLPQDLYTDGYEGVEIRIGGIPRNRFFYYSIVNNSYDKDKMELLKTLDVDVIQISLDKDENAFRLKAEPLSN